MKGGLLSAFFPATRGEEVKGQRSTLSAIRSPDAAHKRSGRMEYFCGELIQHNYCTVGKWFFGFAVGSEVSRFRW